MTNGRALWLCPGSTPSRKVHKIVHGQTDRRAASSAAEPRRLQPKFPHERCRKKSPETLAVHIPHSSTPRPRNRLTQWPKWASTQRACSSCNPMLPRTMANGISPPTPATAAADADEAVAWDPVKTVRAVEGAGSTRETRPAQVARMPTCRREGR